MPNGQRGFLLSPFSYGPELKQPSDGGGKGACMGEKLSFFDK